MYALLGCSFGALNGIYEAGTVAVDMQGLVSEMQSSCPRCMAQRRLHLGNRHAPVHGSLTILLFYYFTILLFYHFTILLFYYSTIPVLYKAVCISETDLRRFTAHLLFYYVTILLFQYCTKPFASRKPTCAGSRFTYYFTILLFYYFTIYYYSSTVLFYDVKCTILLLTIPLFTILPRPQPFASRKPTCAGSRLFYYFTILLFYYFTILLFQYCTKPFASRKPTCAGSRFTYYFTILLFYYFTILLFYYYSSTVLFYYVLFYC